MNLDEAVTRTEGFDSRSEVASVIEVGLEQEVAPGQVQPSGIETARHDRSDVDLTGRTAGSAVWSIAVRLVIKALDFGTLLILARLLAVADFGIIAIAMTAVTIIEGVFEIPIYQVLVGLDDLERYHLDTAFTLSALRGLAIALVLATLAVPLSYFYGDSRLISLIAILSLAPAMRGLGSPRLVIFARKLDLRRELLGEMIGKIASFVLASAAAWQFRDYRALMVAILATPATWIFASYSLAPYRPRISLQAWPLFGHFMRWTTLAQLLSALNWQCDRLVLGRFVGRTELGAFSLANDLSFIPEQALIKPIVRPLISAFALIREDRERLASAYLKSANTILAIGTPVLIGLSLLANPAIRLVLGGKWIAAIPIMQWLALTLIPPLFTSPFSSLAMATGRPKIILWQTAAESLTKLPMMIAGVALMGVNGAIAARALSTMVTALILLYLTKRLIQTPILRQLAATWRTVGGTLVLVAVLLALRPLLDRKTGLTLGIDLTLVSTLAFFFYSATLGILWDRSGRPGGLEHTIFDRVVSPLLNRIGNARR